MAFQAAPDIAVSGAKNFVGERAGYFVQHALYVAVEVPRIVGDPHLAHLLQPFLLKYPPYPFAWGQDAAVDREELELDALRGEKVPYQVRLVAAMVVADYDNILFRIGLYAKEFVQEFEDLFFLASPEDHRMEEHAL